MLTMFSSIKQIAENYEIRPIAGMLVPVRRNNQPKDAIEQDGFAAKNESSNTIRKNAANYEIRPIAGMLVPVKREDQGAKKEMKP